MNPLPFSTLSSNDTCTAERFSAVDRVGLFAGKADEDERLSEAGHLARYEERGVREYDEVGEREGEATGMGEACACDSASVGSAGDLYMDVSICVASDSGELIMGIGVFG